MSTNCYNPWMDIASYKLEDAHKYKGRDEDIERFTDLVESKTMSVLYANSGIGKTSFINAGILPLYINDGYYPIRISFTNDVWENTSGNGIDIEDWIIKQMIASFENQKDNPDKNYWASVLKKPKWKDVSNVSDEQVVQSLWWFLHTHIMIDGNADKNYKPLLIFDQFEEVFSKTNSLFGNNLKERLFKAIEELSSNAVPRRVIKFLEEFGEKGVDVDFNRKIDIKVIFSFRKEYLSDFDYWTNNKFSISELFRSRMFLLPFTREQAEQVITSQTKPDDNTCCIDSLNNVKDIILDKIEDKKTNEIEPLILSVLCRRLYDEAMSKGISHLTKQDVEAINIDTLIATFYNDIVSGVIKDSKMLSEFEEQMVDKDNHRNKVKSSSLLNGFFDDKFERKDSEGKAIETSYKEELEDKHIIRVEKYNGEDYVELIHDRIAEIISNRIEERRRSKANLMKYKSRQNILTLAGRRLMDNCGFDFSEDNSWTIVSGDSKGQLKKISNIHSREYDGSDNVFVADMLNQIVGNDKLIIHSDGALTKDGFGALEINTILLNSQRTINGIVFYETKESQILMCSAEGFNGINIDYDTEGREIRRIYNNSEDGVNVSGVTCYEIAKYDEDGFPLIILFKDDNNKPCKHFDGNYGLEFRYDRYGNETFRRYLAEDGVRSCKIYNQVCGLRSEYEDGKDRVTLQYFVDENEDITEDVYGIVGVRYFYDESTGDISRIEYIGRDQKLCKNPYGFSVVQYSYRNGKRYQSRYYDKDGVTLVNRIDGELRYCNLDIIGYDDFDRINGYILRDVDERRPLKMLFTYYNNGRVSDIRYYDEKDAIGVNPSGVHHVKYEYYDNGLIKCQSHYGINNNHVEDINGAHKVTLEWDGYGRLYKRFLFKTGEDNPYYSQVFEYKSENRCDVTDITYIDSEGNSLDEPIEETQKWVVNHLFQAKEIIYGENNNFIRGTAVRVKFRYNIAGDVTECRLFAVESETPIPDAEGDFGWKIEKFGTAGGIRTFLNENGEISKNKHTYAIVVSDSIVYQGEECTSVSYFDEYNNPVLNEDGYHKIIESGVSGDEKNKQIYYFNCQNISCDCKNGYARQKYIKEEQFGETEIKETVSFEGADGTPKMNQELGYHKREQTFDSEKDGLEVSRIYKNENNDLVNCVDGYAKRIIKCHDSFRTLFYFPFEDHYVIRFYDENDKKVDADFEYNIKGKSRKFHAYKFIISKDASSLLEVKNVLGKTLYRDKLKMWRGILIPVNIIVRFACVVLHVFRQLFKKIRPEKTIQEKTCPIICVAQVYDNVQKGNDYIVTPAKSLGITAGWWIVKWNHWVYKKNDMETIYDFENEFNSSSENKSITFYDPINEQFINVGIIEKNLGLRIQDTQVSEESVNEMCDKAEELYRKQIEILEKQGENTPAHKLADAYNDLGVCLFQQDRNDEAVEAMEHAVMILRDKQDGAQPAAAIHDHLARFYRDMNEYEKAEYHYKENVKLLDKIDGISGDVLADRLMKVGVMLARQEKYDECLEVTKRAWSLTSEDNVDLLRDLHSNLAFLYKEKGDPGSAEGHYRALIDIMEKQVGDVSNHDLADAYDDLGECLFLLDRNNEAIEALKRALELVGKDEDEKHLEAAIHDHLAQVYRDGNEYEKAEYHYKENVKLLDKIDGISGDVLADRLMKVGVMLARQEKYDECLEVTKRAWSLTSEDNVDLLRDLHSNLAFLYKEKGDPGSAEGHYRALIDIMEKQVGNVSNHDLADAYDDLGECLFLLDRNNKAIEALKRALELVGKDEDEKHLEAAIHDHLAQVYRDGNEYEKAEYHYKENVKLLDKIDGISGDVLADRLMKVGVMLARQEKYEECLEVTKRALLLTSEDNVDLLRYVHSSLAFLYNETGELDRAVEHYRFLIDIMGKQGENVSNHDLANTYDDLGGCLFLLDRMNEAKEVLEKALELVGKDEDEEQLTAAIHDHLARVYLKMNELEKNEYHKKESARIIEDIKRTESNYIK